MAHRSNLKGLIVTGIPVMWNVEKRSTVRGGAAPAAPADVHGGQQTCCTSPSACWRSSRCWASWRWIVFLLLHLSLGDPAALIAGDTASSDDVERVRQLGLNRPLHEQFFSWLWRLPQATGVSVFTGLPVAQMIGQRIEPTLWLTFLTISFAVLFAVPMGIIAAWKAGTWIDRSLMALAVLAFSLPVFLIGYLLDLRLRSAWAGCRCRAFCSASLSVASSRSSAT